MLNASPAFQKAKMLRIMNRLTIEYFQGCLQGKSLLILTPLSDRTETCLTGVLEYWEKGIMEYWNGGKNAFNHESTKMGKHEK